MKHSDNVTACQLKFVILYVKSLSDVVGGAYGLVH